MTDETAISRLHRLVVEPATSRAGRFLEGASVPWLGLKVLFFRPRLWKYAVVPILLNLAIMAAAIFAMFVIGTAFITALYFLFGEDWDQGYWFYAKIALLILSGFATVMICIAVAVITWRLLSTIFCGYFYGLIAKSVELELGMSPDDMRDISMWREIRDAFTDMFWLLISLAIALAVAFVPFVGAPLALAYSLYFQILTCGRDQFSYPLSLRGRHRAERIAFCKQHLAHTLGLGSVVLAMEFIPVVGALLMVTAAAGAVILHRRLTETETGGAQPAATASTPASTTDRAEPSTA